MKTRKPISTTEIFPLWPPFFSEKKRSALEQGGVCFPFSRFSLEKKDNAAFAKLCGARTLEIHFVPDPLNTAILKGLQIRSLP